MLKYLKYFLVSKEPCLWINFFRSNNEVFGGVSLNNAARQIGKQKANNSQTPGALLTDLSKAFQCLPHVILVAKINAYEFGLKALKLINNYRVNQRTKTNESYSFW